MNYRDLELFLALANTLHFGRCSEQMFVSPSTLSRIIHHLEEQVGSELFFRDNRSVVLTASGQLFAKYARQALDQWADIRQTLQQDQGPLSGQLSVYCSVTASYSYLYELLADFRQQYPGVAIQLHTGDPEDGIQRVLNGQEDIALAALPQRLPEQLSFKPLGTTPLLFIAPKHFQLNQKKPNAHPNLGTLNKSNRQQWSNQAMILPEQGVARTLMDQWFSKMQVQPTIYAQAAGNEAIVSMVSLGFGLGVVPKIVLDNSLLAPKIQCLKPQPSPGTYQVGLFALTKRLKYPVLKAFWNTPDEG